MAEPKPSQSKHAPWTLLPSQGNTHTHTLILLHGRGSTGPEFSVELLSMRTGPHATSADDPGPTLRKALPNFKLVFPSSPLIWAKTFEGPLPQWFDIRSLTFVHDREGEQVEGLRGVVGDLKRVVEEEVRVLNGERGKVFVMGISQGAAVGWWGLLGGMAAGGLGGVLGFSTWLPFAEGLKAVIKGEEVGDEKVEELVKEVLGTGEGLAGLRKTPVFLGHGLDDAVIDVQWGREVRDTLRGIGVGVQWESYQDAFLQGHWIKEPEGMGDMVKFIKTQIAKQEAKSATRGKDQNIKS